nr:uncharacterized protein LOC111449485 [Ipomoea batatas]GMD76520.1 uncharacterized protein LOC111449485 [Ipomoea batatas]GMD96803.1 uncharacterized protein LOC111449485 [Ipomoea batatas]
MAGKRSIHRLQQRSRVHFSGEPAVFRKNISSIFSTAAEEARWKTVCMGVSICCCWCKYYIHDHADA